MGLVKIVNIQQSTTEATTAFIESTNTGNEICKGVLFNVRV